VLFYIFFEKFRKGEALIVCNKV